METTGASKAALSNTASDLEPSGVREIAAELRQLLADTFVLYIKTKGYHWHIRGRNFRDYHLLLDEHAGQIFAITDEIAERARKLGATTLGSIADISRYHRLQDGFKDGSQELLTPEQMIENLLADNRQFTRFLRATHEICDRFHDVATASSIEVWIDQAERRAWFLAEMVLGS